MLGLNIKKLMNNPNFFPMKMQRMRGTKNYLKQPEKNRLTLFWSV